MKIPGIHKIRDWLRRQKLFGDNASLQPLSKADEQLADLVSKNRIPGMAIAIFQDNKPLLYKGFGYADLENKIPVVPEKTLFRAASVSKPITAFALAMLVKEGLIDLDASIYRYVPYFPIKKYDFTIRQLAAHTAGIRGYKGKEYALNKPFTAREGLKMFQDDPLLFQPGTDFNYNSLDSVLLSLAMEAASGLPFEDYVRKKVLTPFGMYNTISEIPGTIQCGKAEFYTRWAGGFKNAVAVDNRFKLAGGGFLSTVDDLVKLGHSALGEYQSPKSLLDEFLTPQKVNGRSTYYGLGWEVSVDSAGDPYFGHIGNQVGGYSFFRIYPVTGRVAVALVNCTDPKIQDIIEDVIAMLPHSTEM